MRNLISLFQKINSLFQESVIIIIPNFCVCKKLKIYFILSGDYGKIKVLKLTYENKTLLIDYYSFLKPTLK